MINVIKIDYDWYYDDWYHSKSKSNWFRTIWNKFKDCIFLINSFLETKQKNISALLRKVNKVKSIQQTSAYQLTNQGSNKNGAKL